MEQQVPVEIVEILRRSEQGVTRPFICRGDEYHDRLSSALDAWPTILSEVPDAWWFVDDEQTVPVDFDAQAVEALLRGFENDEFWTWT
jgi:hypothetical protein